MYGIDFDRLIANQNQERYTASRDELADTRRAAQNRIKELKTEIAFLKREIENQKEMIDAWKMVALKKGVDKE